MMTSNATSNVTNMMSANTNAREQRFPPRDAPDEAHEARDQQEARDVEPEPLHARGRRASVGTNTCSTRRSWSRVTNVFAASRRATTRGARPEQRRAGQDHAQIERQVAALRAVLRPAHAAAPVVEAQQQRERQQQRRRRPSRRCAWSSPAASRRRRVRIVDDDFGFGGWPSAFAEGAGRARPSPSGRRASRATSTRRYWATKPASVIRLLFSVSSSSRNVSMSLPVRKTASAPASPCSPCIRPSASPS